MWCERSAMWQVIGSESCGHKHVARDKNMSDAELACLLFLGHDETQQSTHCSHHFKPRACLCLFSQCRAFSQSRTYSSKFVKFMLVARPPTECNLRPSTWECAFPRFCFLLCLSFEKAQDRPHCKVHGHEVLHQILWSDTSGSHWQFSVGHCPRMSAHGWKLWKRCRVFRAPRMANSSWFSLRQLQNGFAVCTNVQRACFPLRCFPFGRRTAVDINVYEELRDVRCGIAFFCVHTSIRRCKATAGLDNRGRSTCCFASVCTRDTSWFSWTVEDIARRSFLTFFESLSYIELAVLACTVIVVRKFKHISPRMSIALSPSLLWSATLFFQCFSRASQCPARCC